jgi:hypothetical protein
VFFNSAFYILVDWLITHTHTHTQVGALFFHKFRCETCELSKDHHLPFSPSINKSDAPFVLVHSNVWVPSRVVSLFGYRWFVSIIDDFFRITLVYLLKDKSDVFSLFQMSYKMVQTQFNTMIKIVCSDNGCEYMYDNLKMYFREQGFIYQTTCRYFIAKWCC